MTDCSCHRRIRLSEATVAKLTAFAQTMGITPDQLGERIVVESLATLEHEDLMAPAPSTEAQ